MRSEGDGSQLYSLPHDTRSHRASREQPPGHSGISENAASGEEPGSPMRSLTLRPARQLPCSAPA